MKTNQKIVEYIRRHRQVSGKELADHLGITDRGVRKQLLSLLKEGVLTKKGHPPVVYYLLNENTIYVVPHKVQASVTQIINDNYLYIAPNGEKISGMRGFESWCQKQQLPLEKTAIEYVFMYRKFSRYKNRGFINGLQKLKNTFDMVFLDKAYYLDFYSIDRFGKTKLGLLLLYAKQSQELVLMNELIDLLSPAIEKLIQQHHITSVGFIPPTIRRQLQFMTVLKNRLRLGVRFIEIKKIKSDVSVPQKSLGKLADRIENASQSIVVKDKSKHNNVLLIDDAVGSGATLNETARQLRERGMVKGKIIGLAIVGSYKGFDVISEI